MRPNERTLRTMYRQARERASELEDALEAVLGWDGDDERVLDKARAVLKGDA